ncbi:MAG: DUF4421 family protein [Bacteroidota bacterium]
MHKKKLAIFFLLLTAEVPAQLDSNYVARYNDRFIFSLYQSWRNFDLLMTQDGGGDSTGISQLNYIARGNNNSGFGVDYDKIGFSIGWGTPVTEAEIKRKGKTSTTNFSGAINAKKFRIEMAYRRYRGFYDNYTSKRDTAFTDTSAYLQQPGMFSRMIKVKGFYFINKKKRFSYAAAYANTQRQLKTAGSFVFISNFYNYLLENESSFIPVQTQPFYGEWKNWNRLNVFGLSFNPGYSVNVVVFKRIFLNLTGSLGVELQYRNYGSDLDETNNKDWNFAMSSGDLRASLGYNGEKFLMYLFTMGDFTNYYLDKKTLTLEMRLYSGGLTMAYRFRMKDNKVTTWLKNNRIYKAL